MSKSSNRSHGFWIFYLSFIIFLCIICIIGLSFISSILEDYESAQPYKVVEKYINKLENEDYSYVLGFSGFQYTNFAKSDDCIEVLKAKYSGKEISYLESSSYLGSEKIRYNLYGDGERLGYIILTQTEAKSKYGFKMWKVESCESFNILGKYTVIVPKGYTLYANGNIVGNEYIKEITVADEYPIVNNMEQPSYVTYEMEGFISEPEFTVDPKHGEEYTKTVSESGEVTTFERKHVNYNLLYGFIRLTMEEYINVISLQSDMENYLQYVLEGSEYANTVKNFNKSWVMYQPEFVSTAVENLEILHYEEYTSTQIIAEISFDYKVNLQYSSEVYPSKYRIIFIMTDGEWKIVSMENI